MADSTTPSLEVLDDVRFDGPSRAVFELIWSDPSPLQSVDLFDSDGRRLETTIVYGDSGDATSGSLEVAVTLPRGQYDDLHFVANDSTASKFSTDAAFTLQTGIRGQPFTDKETDWSADGLSSTDFYNLPGGGNYLTDTAVYNSNGGYTVRYDSGSYFNGLNYNSESLKLSSSNKVLQETFYNNDGTHTETALANHQTLVALGNDTMTAAGRGETFDFRTALLNETITDFKPRGAGHDILNITIESTPDLQSIEHQVGNNTVLDLGRHETITLVGVSVHALTRADVHWTYIAPDGFGQQY
jgi:hypothetical protein